jgi:hypothetical protein
MRIAFLCLLFAAAVLSVPVSHAPTTSSAPSEECAMCQELVTVVKAALEQNKTITEITNAVEQMCAAIGNTPLKGLKPECDSLAQRIGEIVPLIVDELDPASICAMLGACPSVDQKTAPTLAAGLDECTVCTVIVKLVETEVQKNTTEEEIKDIVDKLCNYLANSTLHSLEPECRVIEANIDTIIQLIINEADPTAVCTELKYCTSHISIQSSRPVHHVSTKEQAGVDECSICEELVVFAESEVEQKKTSDEISAYLQEICKDLNKTPLSSVSKECQFIASNMDTIVQLLVAAVNPKAVCSLIGLCSSNNPVLVTPRPKTTFGVDECDLCEELTGFLESEVAKNSTIAEIQKFANEACTDLQNSPLSDLYAECQLIAENIPTIVPALINEATPQLVCTELKLCNSTRSAFN